MGFRFRKSVKLPMGFRINFSKSGVGYSWGVKGFRKTYTADGRERTTYSIPGTGISYVEESKKKPSAGTYHTSSDECRPENNVAYTNTNFSRFEIVSVVVSLSILVLVVVTVVGNNMDEVLSDSTDVAMVYDGNNNLNIAMDDTSSLQYLEKLSPYTLDKEETYKNSVFQNYSDDTAFIDEVTNTINNGNRTVQDGVVPIVNYTTRDEIDSDNEVKAVTYTLLTEEEQMVLDEINLLISTGNSAGAYASLLNLGVSVDERI